MQALEAAPRGGSSSPVVDEDDDAPFGLAELFLAKDYTTATYDFPVSRGTASMRQSIDALSNRPTDFDLTGQIVWLVSRVTAHYVAASGVAKGRHAIELGAGAGLVGLLASQLATSIVLTDFEPEVLSLLERNLCHVSDACTSSSVNALSWGSSSDLAALPRQHFDLILGADVVYWGHSISPLVATVTGCLTRDGLFVLGYVERVSAMTVALLAALEAAGLQPEVVGWEWLEEACGEGGVPPEYVDHLHRMTLFAIRWKGAVDVEVGT